ncbi:hypothetical protein F4777DRAFT_36701 [Nemania sp. FL0916]|nr:hypothetical protein F4777DRAFT_36701 [Nemania sp. FL0916]
MSELFPLSLSPDFEQFNQIHMERTLDEAYYPGLGHEALQQRNKDQVVRREFQEQDLILTVPQLWLWRLDNVVVSAFACLEGFESVDRYFRTNLNADIIDIPDCRMADLIAEQAKAFNHEFRIGDDRIPPVLNIFEGAVVSILSDVDAYMREQSSSGLDIDSEGRFVHRISDLRSELAMIQSILDQQHEVLMLFFEDPFPDPSTENLDCKVTLRETLTLVENARRRTEKIDQDAQRIEQVIQDKLNLKRTAASIEIANASIKEARETKLLSIIVLGFTIITLIFTPISFLATLFALDIDTFSSLKYTTNSMPSAVFSGKKMAGIFVGVEVLTFILTGVLTVGAAYFLFRNLDGWMSLVSRAQAAKELERQSKKSAPGAAENADVNKDSEEAVSQLRTGLAPRDSDERPEVEKKQKQGSMTGQLFSTRFRKGKKKVDGIGEAEAGDYGRTTMAWPSPRN